MWECILNTGLINYLTKKHTRMLKDEVHNALKCVMTAQLSTPPCPRLVVPIQ